jgi:diguanylate cyclase (GGDEF)-like protein
MNAGYPEVVTAESATDAFEQLGFYDLGGEATDVELILMDIVMPEINGIEACERLKSDERFKDIPVIIVSGMGDLQKLQSAFDAGAVDYVTKPVNKVEILARIRSALSLKRETDRRKRREHQLIELAVKLEETNRQLQCLSSLDGLTGIPNRRSCDEFMEKEWRRAVRDAQSFAMIMLDIDFFKSFNDTYGHLAGDDCLRSVATALHELVKRPGDLIGRYGGEEFIVLLPETDIKGAGAVAEAMRLAVVALGIPNAASTVADRVTLSAGVAATVPEKSTAVKDLIAAADKALYQAKKEGRNRVCFAESWSRS